MANCSYLKSWALKSKLCCIKHNAKHTARSTGEINSGTIFNEQVSGYQYIIISWLKFTLLLSVCACKYCIRNMLPAWHQLVILAHLASIDRSQFLERVSQGIFSLSYLMPCSPAETYLLTVHNTAMRQPSPWFISVRPVHQCFCINITVTMEWMTDSSPTQTTHHLR